MVLNKPILTRHGATVNYHRIAFVTLNHDHTLDCILQSFVDKKFASDGNHLDEYFLHSKILLLKKKKITEFAS